MADSRIFRCPECGVGAIWVKTNATRLSRVNCENCKNRFTLGKLLELLKKLGRKWQVCDNIVQSNNLIVKSSNGWGDSRKAARFVAWVVRHSLGDCPTLFSVSSKVRPSERRRLLRFRHPQESRAFDLIEAQAYDIIHKAMTLMSRPRRQSGSGSHSQAPEFQGSLLFREK